MKTEENEVITRIIGKYLSGNADKEEKEYLEKWIGESTENSNCYEQLRNIWSTINTQNLLKTIDPEKALKNVLKRISGRSKPQKVWHFLSRTAAILFIPLLLGNVTWLALRTKEKNISEPVFNEVYATFGTRTALKLVDGSLVWLNSGSSMKYPDKFTKKKREVFLNGEAYFEVTSDPDRPFIVNTSKLSIKATGTKFDVMSYSSDFESEITLIEGKVLVSESDTNGYNKLVSEMNPNQLLTFNNDTRSYSINNVDTYKYYSWKDGKLIFRNEPLSEVVKKISQVFNVDIELRGAPLEDYRYRATFEDESLSEILKLLELSSPIKYKEIKRLPLPDGSFPKKKVIIYPVKEKV